VNDETPSTNGSAVSSNGAAANDASDPENADSQPEEAEQTEGSEGASEPGDAFAPMTIGAMYPGIPRGLTADTLATHAMGGTNHPICTTHVVAGRGVVTDVLSVPTDTISAQIEHVLNTESPTAVKVGILSDAATVDIVFRHLEDFDGPIIFDVTLSGPSGEDVIGQRALDAVLERLGVADLVTLRLVDATLLAGMEVPSLDDAQVAIQRIGQRGAENVLLRCGRLPTHFFETDAEPPPFAIDLYYDGSDILLYEAPFLDGLESFHGRSSGLLMPLLHRLQHGDPIEKGLQVAKRSITDALKEAQSHPAEVQAHKFFDALHQEKPSDLPDASS